METEVEIKDIQSIDVYLELCGKQNQHENLYGRDESDQHPIKAITNLQEMLDLLQSQLDEDSTEITSLQEDVTKLDNKIDTKYDEIKTTLKEGYYTNDEVDDIVEYTTRYRGSVISSDYLPETSNFGDIYTDADTGANYLWTGKEWLNLSPMICMQKYATHEYVDEAISILAQTVEETHYTKTETDETINQIVTTVVDEKVKEKVEEYSYTKEQIDEILDTKVSSEDFNNLEQRVQTLENEETNEVWMSIKDLT